MIKILIVLVSLFGMCFAMHIGVSPYWYLPVLLPPLAFGLAGE